MLAWVDHMYDLTYIPRGSKNIKGGYNDQIHTWTLHPPILVVLPKNLQLYYSKLKVKHKNRYPYKDEIFNDIVNCCNEEDAFFLEDMFNTYKPGRCGGLMILNENNTFRTYNEIWLGLANAYLEQRPVRGFDAECPSQTQIQTQNSAQYYYVYVNLNGRSSDYGKVFITYKEYLKSVRPAEYIRVSKKSMFCREINDQTAVLEELSKRDV